MKGVGDQGDARLVNNVKRETCLAPNSSWPCNAAARTAIPASPPIRRWVLRRYSRAHGGTGILSETPEIYGAEHLLTRRAATARSARSSSASSSGGKTTRAQQHGDEQQPLARQQAGGLTTILEKSLGAAAKGGTTTCRRSMNYAEPVTAKGFVFMDTPGYDPGRCDGPGCGRGQSHVLHHRPRLGLWLQAMRPRSSLPPTRRSSNQR
jgi:hypothetical protein